MGIIITNHAYQRAKERLRWSRDTINRMSEKAYESGIKHADTTGRLNKYITKLWFQRELANNIRIYGENIFFFTGNTLLTVHQIPNNLKNHIKK